MTKNINLKTIRIDGDTQSRVRLDDSTVAEYSQFLADGGALPAVIVFFDGADNWLADGFHRFHAYVADKRASIPADVRTGTRRDAMLYSFGANGTHGLRRTNEDKRKAVSAMLADPEWSSWSDRKIAEQCGVTHPFVASIRAPKVVTVTTPQPAEVETVTTPEKVKAKQIKAAEHVEPQDDDRLSEASHTINALSQEVEELRGKLAVEQMDGSEEAKAEASELIADLRARVRALEAELASMRAMRDRYQAENVELHKQLRMNAKREKAAA